MENYTGTKKMKGQKKEGKEKEVGRKERRKEEGRGQGDEQSKLYSYLEVGAISKQGPKPQRLRLEEQVDVTGKEKGRL